MCDNGAWWCGNWYCILSILSTLVASQNYSGRCSCLATPMSLPQIPIDRSSDQQSACMLSNCLNTLVTTDGLFGENNAEKISLFWESCDGTSAQRLLIPQCPPAEQELYIGTSIETRQTISWLLPILQFCDLFSSRWNKLQAWPAERCINRRRRGSSWYLFHSLFVL